VPARHEQRADGDRKRAVNADHRVPAEEDEPPHLAALHARISFPGLELFSSRPRNVTCEGSSTIA
jgi:hypothetical protein